jgi:hypothetical protein
MVAAQLVLLCPEFDELRWTVYGHEQLLDMWDELGR